MDYYPYHLARGDRKYWVRYVIPKLETVFLMFTGDPMNFSNVPHLPLHNMRTAMTGCRFYLFFFGGGDFLTPLNNVHTI